MPKFEIGEKVTYIPEHADGPDHPATENGVIKEERRTGWLVDYFDESPVTKLTQERFLVPREAESDDVNGAEPEQGAR